jgi:chemotaxis signal transduction protein
VSDVWSEVRVALDRDWTQPPERDPRAVFEARARRLAQTRLDQDTVGVETEMLVLRVGSDTILLPAASVLSISRLTKVTTVPGAPDVLRGLAQVRGALVPVFDIGPLIIGCFCETDEASRLVTLGGNGHPDLTILVESVVDTTTIPEALIPPPADAPSPIAGLTQSGELVLDARALLASTHLTVNQHER